MVSKKKCSIEVIVWRGRDLHRTKKGNEPSTFCVVRIGNEAYKTSTIDDSSVPSWNSVIKFKNKSDKFIGRLMLGISEIEENQFKENTWHILRNKKEERVGDIMLNIKFTPSDAPAPSPLIPSDKSEKKIDEAKERNQLIGDAKPKSGLKSVMEEEPSDTAEVKMLISEANKVKKSSKESTSRSLQLLSQSCAVGAKSLENLDDQGKQLQRMSTQCDVFDVRMEESRRQLRSIGSFFGSIANKFSKNKRKVRSQFVSEDKTKSEESPKSESKLEVKERKEREELMKGAVVSKEEQISNTDKDEVDEDLQEMSYRLKDLKAIATAFSQEIDQQTPHLEELNKQMTKNETELRANMWKLRKL